MDGALTPELLLRAYASGIFPMSDSADDPDVFWVDPKRRGILPLDGGFHISRTLAKRIRAEPFRVSLDEDFCGVVSACADRPETWINETIFALYKALFNAGFAHSLELYDENELVGGVYGVALGAAFFGESMFSRRSSASKIALAYLTTHLKKCGYQLFDTQFVTPHLLTLGAQEISRGKYRKLLEAALEERPHLSSDLPTVQEVLQRRTQTS